MSFLSRDSLRNTECVREPKGPVTTSSVDVGSSVHSDTVVSVYEEWLVDGWVRSGRRVPTRRQVHGAGGGGGSGVQGQRNIR